VYVNDDESLSRVVALSVDEKAALADLEFNGVPEEDPETDSHTEPLDERLNDCTGVLETELTGDREIEFVADVDLDTYTLGVKDFVIEPL
jgi:hypothetical protein